MKRETCLAALLLGCCALPVAGAIVCNELPLTEKEPHFQDQFGCSVSIHGNLAIIGANLDDAAAADGGAITPFHKTGEGWLPEPEITAPDARQGDQFGFSASVDGDWLAVGAPFADSHRAADAGAVYLFRRDGDRWVEPQKLTADDAARGDRFGLALSLSGDTLLVGAPNHTGNAGSLSGAVYVFRLDGETWAQRQRLAASNARPFDNFGFSVSLDGGTAIVGAPFHDRGTTAGNSGMVYVFKSDGAVWSERARLELSDGAADDQFGSAVAVSGSTLAVGARGADAGGLRDTGAVYIYGESGGAWSRTASFSGQAAGDQFGVAVSLSGDRLLVGARFRDANGHDSGAAYLYVRHEGTWPRDGEIIAGDAAGDQAGQAVSIDGSDFLIGAYLGDVGSFQDAGTVKVCPKGPNPTVDLSITKNDSRDVVCEGEETIYTITVENNLSAPVTGAKVQEQGNDITGLSELQWCRVKSGKTCTDYTPGLLDETVDLPPDDEVLYRVKGTVVGGSGTVTNRVCVLPPPGTTNSNTDNCNTDTDTVSAVDLALTTTAPTAVCGGALSVTLTVTNVGRQAANGVQVVVHTPLKPVSLPPGCKSLASGDVVCTLGQVRAGSRVDLPFTFEIPKCYPGGPPISAEVSTSDLDCDSSNDAIETPFSVDCSTVLTLGKTGPPAVNRGDPIPYTLKVTNVGLNRACEVALNDPIPANLSSPLLPPGCGVAANEIRCPIGDLDPDEMRTVGFSLTVPQTASCGSKISNTATATARNADPVSAMTMTTVACCGLSISKTDGLETAMPGQALLYTITVANSGPNVPEATITDNFPSGLTMVRWCRDMGGPPCTPSQGGDLQETIPLPSGGSAVYRVQGSVALKFSGALSNTATVVGPPGCAASATDVTQVGFTGVKAFCQNIQGNFSPGGMITYTFILLNGGPAAQADNPGDEFTDVLPATLTLTGASADSGTAATVGNMATWNGSIPVGGMVMITVTATIDPFTPIGTTICNQAVIAFDADGDGINESNGVSDDPGQPGPDDPCCFQVSPPDIPALSSAGLAALALLLAGLAVLRLRIRGRRS